MEDYFKHFSLIHNIKQLILSDGVIGNTSAFGADVLGSSPSRITFGM
jgi:hypothetical protein